MIFLKMNMYLNVVFGESENVDRCTIAHLYELENKVIEFCNE
jgi:hypothetical protein